jgi:hypothetical protein
MTAGRSPVKCHERSLIWTAVIGIIEPPAHRVHREKLGNLSVVSARCLCDLCAKFLAFLQPLQEIHK